MKVSFRSFFLTLPVIASFAAVAASQCPSVSVAGPDDSISAGETMTFAANIVSGETKSPFAVTYNWSVSNGAISGGQGTSVIKVDTAGLGGQSVTATLEIGGLPIECPRSASETGSVRPAIVANKIDEYVAGNEELELLKLDNFVIYLQNEPNAEGYLIAYRGPKGKVGDAKAAIQRIRRYLVTRGVNLDRIKTIDGGVKETAMRELWLVPQGAEAPKAAPTTVKPTTTTPAKPAAKKKT